MTPTCPRCGLELERAASPAGHACPGCGGQALAVGQLRRSAEDAAVNELWQAARSSPVAGVRCPSCTSEMGAVAAFGVELDVCRTCQWVWFDRGERDALGSRPPEAPAEDALPEEAVRALARLRAGEGARAQPHRSRGFLLADLLEAVFLWWP